MRLLLAATVVLILAGCSPQVGVTPGSAPPTPTGPDLDWTPSDYEAAIVRPGDRVTATGFVIAYPGLQVEICLGGAVAGVGGGGPHPPFACGAFKAPLDGLELNALPGRSEAGGAVYSPSALTVLGTWTGTSIKVASVELAAPMQATTIGLPCPAPTAGWPSPQSATSSLVLENAVRPLANEIAAHPELFSAYWGPESAGSGPTRAVVVVGTVDDPDAVRPRLESLYPYGVCVIKVKYSAADLQRALDALAHAAPDRLQAYIDPPADRVRVQLTLISGDLATLLEAHPEAAPQPLMVSR
jgi:hypothetical protein